MLFGIQIKTCTSTPNLQSNTFSCIKLNDSFIDMGEKKSKIFKITGDDGFLIVKSFQSMPPINTIE